MNIDLVYLMMLVIITVTSVLLRICANNKGV
jgi:hypothetical protein